MSHFHVAQHRSTRGAYRIVGVATDVSIVALLYDIPKYRPSRSMGGDSHQHAQTCWCRCGILSRPTSTCSRRRLGIAFSDLDQYVAVSDLSRHVGIDGVWSQVWSCFSRLFHAQGRHANYLCVPFCRCPYFGCMVWRVSINL